MARNKLDLDAWLANEMDDMQRRRRAVRLCPVLLDQLNILDRGVDLVCWISDSNATDNRGALVDWIVTQLADEQFMNEAQGRPEAEILLERLRRRLGDRRASVEPFWLDWP